jgi:hypothetical protein
MADALGPEIDEVRRPNQLHGLEDHHRLFQDQTGTRSHRQKLEQLAAVVAHRRSQTSPPTLDQGPGHHENHAGAGSGRQHRRRRGEGHQPRQGH